MANLSLIPRFNLDYKFGDFIYGLKNIFDNNTRDLSTLINIFGNRKIFFTNNGRASLYVILKSLNLPKDSKVAVPLYSCTVVFDAIIMAGYVPCFIDIDPHNYTMDPNDLKFKIEDVRAVVVIHTFGRPADMRAIKNIAGSIPVIEDCAHSLLSEYKGQLTGTMGDASFFSLAKYISAGGGGMIIVNNNKLEKNIAYNIKSLSSPSTSSEMKHSLFTFIYSFLYHRPWYGGFAFPIGCYVRDNNRTNNRETFKATKIKKSDLNVFLKKIANFRKSIELQRKNSLSLLNHLKSTSLTLPYENQDTVCNYFYFPLLFANKARRDNANEFLNRMGLDTAKLFSDVSTEASKHYGYKNDCPNAENLADRVLIIPNYYTLKVNELSKITDFIKKLEEFNENNSGSRTS